MKTVQYCRYSSEKQNEQSVEGQLRECKDFAKKNGMTVLSSYIDRTFSAKSDKRPQFQQIIKDSAKRYADGEMVTDITAYLNERGIKSGIRGIDTSNKEQRQRLIDTWLCDLCAIRKGIVMKTNDRNSLHYKRICRQHRIF